MKAVRDGDGDNGRAGTCNQTGNSAPKFNWPHAVRVLIACIAYHQGYTDDQMARKGKNRFPRSKDTFAIFQKTLPWFESWYNAVLKSKSISKGYPLEKLKPFAANDVHGRLHYLFAEPGSTKASREQERKYGISKEHHDAIEQYNRRRIVFARCSQEIHRRLTLGLTISRSEIDDWSRLD